VIKPLVAIIGRQNVGKSTLLNRLAGKRIAIVEDLPGTTRDRVLADVVWQDKEFTVVDTGGLEITPDTEIGRGVRHQVSVALGEADIILFVVDAKNGVMPDDLEIADMLRRSDKPVILVVNKVDNERALPDVAEFYQLGLDDPIPISAYHASGTAELLDRIIARLPALQPPTPEPEMLKVAIVGRPNVGKSMLLNALVGEERSIVSETPGTTRDAVDTILDFDGKSVLLIDTAGIRRRGQIETGIEWYSVLRSLRAIDRCDVALLVLDATELPTAQDTHIAGYIQQAAKGMVLVSNKWDLVADRNVGDWEQVLKSDFKFMIYAPMLTISAMTGQGVDQLIPTATRVYEERQKRLNDAEVRGVVQQAVALHTVPRKGKRELVIKSVSQTGISPPTFTFRVNDSRLIHFSYQRYLENRLREAFGFYGTPLRLVFSSGGGS
jgi:GTP-binding protein